MNQKYMRFLAAILLFGLIDLTPTQSAEFSEIPVICTGLAGLRSVSEIVVCTSDFNNNLKEYYDAINSNKGGQTTTKIPDYVLCCQINILQSCITKQIGTLCGDKTEDLLKTFVKDTLKVTNYLANQVDISGAIPTDCDLDAWYFQKESPVCWSFPAQVALYIALHLLVILGCCWCCCRICCLCCRKTKAVHTTVLIPYTAGNFSLRPNHDPLNQPLVNSEV